MSKYFNSIKDAVTSYASVRGTISDKTWLGDYLSQKLTGKKQEEIGKIVEEITDTLDLQAQKLQSLQAARTKGLSAEEWFSEEIGRQGIPEDEVKVILPHIPSALRESTGNEDAELENDLASIGSKKGSAIKGIVKKVARFIGNTALSVIASDEYSQKIEEETAEAEQPTEEKSIFRRLLEEGAVAGLKVAVSAGLTIASAGEKSESAPIRALATVAHKVVEESVVFCDVIRGKKKISEAVRHIKDTAVAAVAGIIEQERSGELGRRAADAIGRGIGAVAGYVFGPVGAKVGAAVGAFLGQTITSDSVVSAVKAVGTAAKKAAQVVATGAVKVGKKLLNAIFG